VSYLTKRQKQSGFTIVELLIVIVVIAILAAITIVAYNGIQSRARTSSAQAAANSLDKKAESYNAINNQYPNTADVLTCQGASGACGTQNSVATTTSSDWYSTPSATATQSTVLPTAAPSNPNMIWYFPSGTVGACIYYWDYSQSKVVPVTAGSPSTACAATPNSTTGFPLTTTTATRV
jgi:prepilin-type N-terminal cleavage/methylation domain-containing protein